ncbi:hypothetical protein D3C78_543400 [compost metagenome]
MLACPPQFRKSKNHESTQEDPPAGSPAAGPARHAVCRLLVSARPPFREHRQRLSAERGDRHRLQAARLYQRGAGDRQPGGQGRPAHRQTGRQGVQNPGARGRGRSAPQSGDRGEPGRHPYPAAEPDPSGRGQGHLGQCRAGAGPAAGAPGQPAQSAQLQLPGQPGRGARRSAGQSGPGAGGQSRPAGRSRAPAGAGRRSQAEPGQAGTE